MAEADRLLAPRSALRGLVSGIFTEAGRHGPMLFPATPSPSLTVFLCGASIHEDGRAFAYSLLAGPQGRARWASMLPGTAFVTALFRPGALPRVLVPGGLPEMDEAGELAAFLPQAEADALVQAVRRHGTMAGAVAALEDWLLARTARPPRRRGGDLWLPPAAIAMPIAAVAAGTGRSPRQAERLFRQTFGASQRELRALLRYGRMLGGLLAGTATHGLGAAALDCGYYDQAQMARDMRRFAGLSAREVAAAARGGGGPALSMFRYGEGERRLLLG
ncbi:hypothetical protein BKK79_30330 [Cupriavidus sp. USMAA2-4]|uniref:helix-turn-helix domain-containing protein n=1 Tax=Cupriavidus sp. USMAA2-4 TaxID=876364 RepID=UPI0008A68266|nr:helix-turn-helix domain-containing protein [Cupriavidus sp. USMAA2-4]AOY95970.1 hypothetical protein BKK79_30330 [Cupriavidus sp. USMAA2-4]